MEITTASKNLFIALASDAVNWNGQPLLDVTKEERGNVTHLKKLGLIKTIREERCDFVDFTDAGKAYAAELGINL